MGQFIQSDPERTGKRFRRLHEYVRQNLLVNGQFICKHYSSCLASSPNPDAFYEGQMSHLGEHYDLTVDGQDFRIVFVGQEYGSRHRCVTLEERTAMVDPKRGFKGRNPHMKGTTSLLRLMLGRAAGVAIGRESYCASLILCPRAISSVASPWSISYCARLSRRRESTTDRARALRAKPCTEIGTEHFRATLEILEPTVIVAQGQSVRSWIECPLGLGLRRKPPGRYDGPVTPETTRIAGRPVQVLTFYHPSAPYTGWWGRSPDSKYFKKVVEPIIRSWRASL